MIAALRVERIDYFADGLRNELRFRPPHIALDGPAPGVVFFGYALLNDLVRSQLGPITHEVLSFRELSHFWKWLAHIRPATGRALPR